MTSTYDSFVEGANKRALTENKTIPINPFKDLREQGSFVGHDPYSTDTSKRYFTQTDFKRQSMQAHADNIGIGKMGLLRAEQGFYASPERIIDYYAELYELSSYLIERAYSLWRSRHRYHNRRAFDFTVAFGSLRNKAHPLESMLVSVRIPTHPLDVPPVGKPISLTEFCKLTCVNQSTVTRWYKKPAQQQTVPSEILVALAEMQYTDREINDLINTYNTYRRELTNVT